MFRNCYPGTKELIDIVARYDDEEDCYIWNNDVYSYKGWRNKDVQIPKGRYFIIVSVFSNGEEAKGYFKLENNSSIINFRLLNVSNEELKNLKQER